MAHRHLSQRLQAEGLDMDLINEILKLKEVERLVEKGKVTPEIYEHLVNDVLSKRSANVAATPDASNPPNRRNIMGRLRGVINMGNSRRRRSSVGEPSSPRPRAGSAAGKRLRPKKPSKGTVRPELPKLVEKEKILEDQLFRLGTLRNGEPKWKKVDVILFPDSIEYTLRGKSGQVKQTKTVNLSEDFFVNGDVASLVGDTEKATKAFEQPHIFLLSDITSKFYFAAEDDSRKEFWVLMLAQVLKDLEDHKKSGGGGNLRLSKSRRFVTKYETLQKKYFADQVRKTMRLGTVQDFSEEKFAEEEAKWKRQGAKMARQSVVHDLRREMEEKAKEALREQEELRKQLKDKELALEKMQLQLNESENTWETKYEGLLAKFRAEANERNNDRQAEQVRLKQQIQSIRRMSVQRQSTGRMTPGDEARFREFEHQIEMYKTKLAALQSVLDVDLDNLDWDGTLEDAETKMKALIPELSDPDETKAREAQGKFDQWDHIVRNHADYKARENNKWVEWEEVNKPKNLAALKEMQSKYVPAEFARGISAQNLMQKMNINKKIATRVLNNKVFKFFWMEKDSIAKIHSADLLNNYACQGLDIREMRAIYASLPETFQNDNDGKKKQFRENIRVKLAELCRKEAAGSLSPPEALNNAYRDKAIRSKRAPPKGRPARPKMKNNNKMKAKAMALQAMLEGKASGGPAGPPAISKPAPRAATKNDGQLNPNDPKWAKFFKMAKMLPEGAVMNALQKDGIDPSVWHKLKAMKDKAKPSEDSSPKHAPVIRKTSSNGPRARAGSELPAVPRQKTQVKFSPAPVSQQRKKSQLQSEFDNIFDQAAAVSTKPLDKKHKSKKKKLPKRHQKRKTLEAATSSALTRSHHVNTDTAGNLVDKATLNVGIDFKSMANASSRAFGNLEYAGQSHGNLGNSKKNSLRPNANVTLSQQRAANFGNAVQQSILELVDVIVTHGETDKFEGGIKTMKFGDLFKKYEAISDMLVGLLLKAKRKGFVKYRGDMLFNGIHDNIKITAIAFPTDD